MYTFSTIKAHHITGVRHQIGPWSVDQAIKNESDFSAIFFPSQSYSITASISNSIPPHGITAQYFKEHAIIFTWYVKGLVPFWGSCLPQRVNSITNNTGTAGMPFQTVPTRWIFFFFLEPLIFVCLFACCIIYKTVLHFCTAPILCKFNTTYFFHTRKSSLPPCCLPPVCDLIRSHRWPGCQRKKQSQGNGIVKFPNLTENGVW